MSNETEKKTDTQNENGNRPDFVAKTTKGYGRKARFERIGVGWARQREGGICLRLIGTQIVNEDIYLFPIADEAETTSPVEA